MSNLTKFESAEVPAHIAARFSPGGNDDLSSGVGGGGFPVISYKGKVWHVVQGENRVLVTNDEGEPKASLDVVILKANPHLSKIYYATGYEEGSAAKPTCYSNNGVGPAADAQDPQSIKCAICPHNVWGSRQTENGGKGKSCSDSRRMAVTPLGDLENPMLLRVPAGSLKDLAQYAEMLNRRRVQYAAVVTRIGFDHTVAHQKFTFKAMRYLGDGEADTTLETLDKDVIGNIVGTNEVRVQEPEIAGKPPAAMALKPKAHAPAVEPEEEEEAAPPPSAKKAAPTKPDVAKVVAEADSALNQVLGMFDDD